MDYVSKKIAGDIRLPSPQSGGWRGTAGDRLFAPGLRWLRLLRCWWRGYHLFGRHQTVGKLSCRTCNKTVDQVSPDGKFHIVYWPVK